MKKLADYARENNIPYHKLYNQFRNGKSSNIVKNSDGLFYQENSADNKPTVEDSPIPMAKVYFAEASDNVSRRNVTSKSLDVSQYANIENGFYPYFFDRNTSNNSMLNIRDVIILMEKAYHNFSILRNTISLMVEFSTSNIYFEGGNAASRKWFESFFKSIGLFDIQNQFYREFYRSGNVFIYPLTGKVEKSIVKRIEKIMGSVSKAEAVSLPFKYIFLQPADIELTGSASFSTPIYQKRLNPYELENLRNPQTKADKIIYESLPEETKRALVESKGKTNSLAVYIPLPDIVAIFNGKQDYEAFASPMFFPILADLNRKEEMKKMDIAVMRTTNQCILMITVGAELKNGKIHQNESAMSKMQELFSNESVGRVIIADWTTKGEFLVPDISDILDPKKYQILNEDINVGLNNILSGGEKFANQSMKTQIFVERLKQGREYFLTKFLIPQMQKIGETLGFKNIPTPKYEEANLKDELEFARIYTRLIELGVLTPAEGIEAIQSGKLPTQENSIQNQKEHAKHREDGLYYPITTPPVEDEPVVGSSSTGRPVSGPGKKIPSRKPAKASLGRSEEQYDQLFSFEKIKNAFIKASELESHLQSILKDKFSIASLSETQLSLIKDLAVLIMTNEPIDKWIENSSSYAEKPVDTNLARVEESLAIGAKHGVDKYLSAILLNSKNNE